MLLVQKFGGTSVASVERLQQAARRIAYERERGHQVVVVVSAMAGVTNDLLVQTQACHPSPETSEVDVVVAAGEQMTAGLLAIALQHHGLHGVSQLGWQVPIKTTDHHQDAQITGVETAALQVLLERGCVPIVAGFQGVTAAGRISTLGRGGSDITAVALAVALKADRCDLYKDVAGIYSADPRIVPTARKWDVLSAEEMLELSSLGSKVLHVRAVQLAMQHGLPLRIFSSFEESHGTHVIHQAASLENVQVRGVVLQKDTVLVTLSKAPLAKVMEAFGARAVPMDMLAQQEDSLQFAVPHKDKATVKEVLAGLGCVATFNAQVAKIALVGLGVFQDPLLRAQLFETLAQKSIPILAVSATHLRLSVLVPEEYAELAVRALHQQYGLDVMTPQHQAVA